MRKGSRFLGLDVHAESIAVAVAEPGGEVRSLGTIPNRPEAIRRLVKRLGAPESLRACYEAGPCGYVLYWQLSEMGVACEVVAPTLVPTKPGDRVKTDRRDAEKLARCFRSGDLTPVWVPDAAHEALRDLMRAREAAKQDQLRARNRLQKFLLRHGRRRPDVTAWTAKHLTWIRTQVFEQAAQQATFLDYLMEVEHAADRVARLERAVDDVLPSLPTEMMAVIDALQALRGVARLTAATIVAEVGPLTRFTHPRQLMGYAGIVPSEHSSGSTTHRSAITKTGNAHLRRVIVEAAWTYQHRPAVLGELRRRQRDLNEEVKAVAWKAQLRLCGKYRRLVAKGKPHGKVVAAVARELLGFIWAIGVLVGREREHRIAA
jgi:transposase